MQRQLIYFLLLSLVVAIFVLSNSEAMTVQLFFWSYSLSGSLVILISLALGGLLVFLFGISKQLKSHLQVKDLEKQNHSLKSQLEQLKASQVKLEQSNEELKAQINQLSLEVPSKS